MRSASSQSTYITRRLNDAWRVAWFDAVVALPFLFFFMLGLVTEQKIVCTAIGVGLAYAIQRLKAAKHPAFFSHLMRWLIPEWLLLYRCPSFPSPEVQGRIG